MSYVRWSDHSDVYVFEHVNGCIQCCGCVLMGEYGCFDADTAAEMDDHLREHIAAGHMVPDGIIGNMDDPEKDDG